MQTKIFVESLERNVAIIKTNYERYQEDVEITFQGRLPLPIVNREEEIQLLFEELVSLLPHRCLLGLERENVHRMWERGEYIYDRLQKQITQLDCLQNPWSYEVQRILTNIRICFYYLLQEIDEMDEMGAQKKC